MVSQAINVPKYTILPCDRDSAFASSAILSARKYFGNHSCKFAEDKWTVSSQLVVNMDVDCESRDPLPVSSIDKEDSVKRKSN